MKNWSPSDGATLVEDEGLINLATIFCDYVGKNLWDKIEFFDSKTLESKRQLHDDNLSKNEVFSIASQQLKIHKKLWVVNQKEDCYTYEFPLAVEIDSRVRYMKFQISKKVKGLASPSKVKKVWLRYHISRAVIEVKYVEN